MHPLQLRQLIDTIILSLYEAALKKIGNNPKIKGVFDALMTDLNVNLSEFKTVNELNDYFSLIKNESHKLSREFTEFVHAFAFFAQLKFVLQQFSINDTVESFARAVSALNNTYAEKIMGPTDIHMSKVNDAMHGLDLMCNRTSTKLLEKGYCVTQWKLKNISQHNTADHIEKWITYLPNEYTKPIKENNNENATILNFKSKVQKTRYLAEKASENGNHTNLIERKIKSQAKAIRIREIMAKLDKKFNRRLQSLENIVAKISDSYANIESHEYVSADLAERIIKIKDNLDYLCALMDSMEIVSILNFNVFVEIEQQDINSIKTLSAELIQLLDNYKQYFELVQQFQFNKDKLAEVKNNRKITKQTLIQHSESIQQFWRSCVNDLKAIADQYVEIATTIQPTFSLTELITKHFYLIAASALLTTVVSILIATLILSLSITFLILFVAASLIVGIGVALLAGIAIDTFQTQPINTMTPDDVAELLGPLKPESRAQTEYELDDFSNHKKPASKPSPFSIWADIDVGVSLHTSSQIDPTHHSLLI